jgi:hypothetical protein
MAQTKEEPAMEKNMSLKDVARLLGVKAYRVQYAIVHGVVAEPQCRISGRRIFEPDDVEALATHFGVKVPTGECEAVGV